MSVAEASEFFLDFDQQQPQQEPVANVLQVLHILAVLKLSV